ncbi:hypothetical protein GCM10007160_16610 [Litchfieldella qijiaojingensis]|uniref:DUF1326 domain-containing protein n=1 Tax=Litchfieldella qijiaojingensis TaxID=980347 RepID=A0ABQ2YNB2_9GAMM|nr:DUF1326 domain-containing protein [Halomonas qijiaojingensis]GGX89877.1 hypothetical protein GCM10007160_16610 [Halomonas qijiaojingensis]
MIDWSIESVTFGNCNCDYNCPCQFELRPTQGNCRGFEVGRIEHGHFDDISLDGLRWALLYAWPGAIFEGNGTMQAIIDERADERQRQALITVLHGGETEEAKTHWWVFHAMSSTVHEPLFKPIDVEIDIESRTARVSIPGVLVSSGQPIISPATGEEHRVRIDIPAGIEFEIAEIGSASAKATGAIELDLNDSYGQFNVIRHSGTGVVHTRV